MPKSHSRRSTVTSTVAEADDASAKSTAGPSNQDALDDLALRDADTPENQKIWDLLLDEKFDDKQLGGAPNAPGWAVDPGPTPLDALAPMRAQAEQKPAKKESDAGAIAGGAGAGLAGAGAGAGVVGGSMAVGAGATSATATPATGTAQGATQAGANPALGAAGLLKPVTKVAQNATKTAMKGKKAKDTWDGGEKRHRLNGDVVETDVRGQDTPEANGFMKELARDEAEAAGHAGVKTVTGGLKATSKVMDVGGVPVSEAVDVLGLNPVASAGQIGSGVHKVGKGSADIARHQIGKKAARSGEKEASERGDLLTHGLHQAKTGHSRARNRAGQQVALGSLEATKGGLGIAQFADPTGGTAAAHAAIAATSKIANTGTKAYNAVKDGRKWEKVQKMRAAAEAGDPKAAKWMLANDPRTASAQMLMHAQTGEDEDRSFAQDKIAAALDLGKDGKRELATGKLSEFDKLYAARTGQDIESQLDLGSAAMYGALGPTVDRAGKAAKKVHKKVKGGASPAPEVVPAAGESEDEHAAEFQRVTQFRNQKTYEEMVDKGEQKSLKKRKKAGEKGALDKIKGSKEATGELYNPDNFATAEEMVDQTHAATMKGKMGKIEKKRIAAAKGADMPYLKNKSMPEDVRGGVVALEQARRDQGETVGQALPAEAPTGDWVATQVDANADEKQRRKAAKEAGTLPGQVAKSERKAERARRKTSAEASA